MAAKSNIKNRRRGYARIIDAARLITNPGRRSEQLRYHISMEAARILAEEGVSDYHTAKCKAAERINQPDLKHLPSNREVDAALRRHLELFHRERLDERLQEMRRVACDAMAFFTEFDPLLTGPVLGGVVTANSTIQLHVTADAPEAIALLLASHRIPYDQTDRRMRFGGDRYLSISTFAFQASELPIEVAVFSRESRREPPLSPVDGQPMQRINAAQAQALLATTTIKLNPLR